jgi:predicted nucleotidyltransferase
LRDTLAGYEFYTYFCASLLTGIHIHFFTFVNTKTTINPFILALQQRYWKLKKLFMDFFSTYTGQIADLCRKYNVRKLFAFGSVLTDKFNEQSDIDLIVNFDKNAVKDYFNNYFDFKYSLEDVFGREVDLLEDQPVRNSYLKKNIENTKILIYG